MKQVLIVIDMQNDFITGSLGTPEAQAIVPKVITKIKSKPWDSIIFTRDTHYNEKDFYSYEDTLEGEKLPVKHCILGERGWQLNENVLAAAKNGTPIKYIDKPTFGSRRLLYYIRDAIADMTTYFNLQDCDDKVCDIDVEVEICGLCTDICVISNALLLRAAFPNMKITCDSSCCAGVTPEKHLAALEVMRSCQIDVI